MSPMTRASGWFSASIALLALLASPALAGKNATKIYRDPVQKCSFLTFPDWDQVPAEPTEPWVVAKFLDPSSKGDFFKSELTVVRIVKGGGDVPLTGEDLKDKEGLKDKMTEAFGPKTAWDATAEHLWIQKGATKPDPKLFKKITSDEKVEGKIWQFELPYPEYAAQASSKKDAVLFATLVTYEKDSVEYGLYMVTTGRRADDYKNAFKRIGQSFSFFNEKAGEVKTLDVLKDVKISPRKRSKIERGLVKGWKVIVSPKKNYVVIYNSKDGENDALAKVLSERIEKIREQVYEKQFPPSKPIDTVSVMRVCASHKEYVSYGGSPSSAGYWNSFTEELVFFDAAASKKPDDDTLAVLYHEAFHQYIYYSVGNVAPHSWFNEGHGDYYAGSRYNGGKFKIEPFDWRKPVVKKAVADGPRSFQMTKDPDSGEDVKKWSDVKGFTPLADLVKFSQRDYYAYPSVSYAQGWALVYFLREVVPKNEAYNKKWGKILPTYFDVLKREAAKEKGFMRGGDEPDGPDEPDGEPDDPAGGGDGKDGDPGKPGEDGKPGAPGDAPPEQTGVASASALDLALQEAFKGVDMDELQAAWIAFVKNV